VDVWEREGMYGWNFERWNCWVPLSLFIFQWCIWLVKGFHV